MTDSDKATGKKAEKTSEYLKNYQQLQEAAEFLANQETPDVDAIMPKVEQGSKAYAECMKRIEAVEKMLKEMEKKSE